MPCVKRCCCCVTLRMGGITMGVMTLALSLFSVIPMAIFFAHRIFLSRVVTHMLQKIRDDKSSSEDALPQGGVFWGTVTDAFSQEGTSKLPPEDDQDVLDLANVMFFFFIVAIVLLVIYLLCSILLIYGAAKGRRWFLLPWIIATFLFLLAYIGGLIFSMILIGITLEILLLLGFSLVEAAIGFYLWVCIVSLFQVLGSEEFRNGGGGDWELKPRFSTTYNSVPTHE